MTPKEAKTIKDSIRKDIEIYKKDIQWWQQQKKMAQAMIDHDKRMIRDAQAKLKQKALNP